MVARPQAELGADTLSPAQLNDLWRRTKEGTNKALHQAARDGLPPLLSPTTFPGTHTAPEFSSGAGVITVPREAAPLYPLAGRGSLRDDLLHYLEAGLTPHQL